MGEGLATKTVFLAGRHTWNYCNLRLQNCRIKVRTEVYCATLSLQSGYLAGKKRACEARSLIRKLAFTLSSPCLWQMLQRPQLFIGQGCKKPDFWNKVIENCKKYYCWKVLKSPVIVLYNTRFNTQKFYFLSTQ